MSINLQDIINRVTLEKAAEVTVAPEVAAAPAPAVAPAVAPEVAPVAPVAAVTEPTLEEQQKVAAEMDDAGRIMARAFHDELQKLAVGAHGYVDTKAEDPVNPVQTSLKPERMENASKAIAIIQQLTAGERVKGPEGYVQVNGQPVEPTAPEIAVEEHPTAYDVTKKADAKIITAVYKKFFGEN
jgi:hypothetical protein